MGLRRREERAKERRRRAARRWVVASGGVSGALAVGAAALHRRWYPAKQVCPPADDYFHQHCIEGREHYRLEIDWECLGPANAKHLRGALGVDGDGAPPYVTRWLPQKDARFLDQFRCTSTRLDRACYYCVPTPKPKKEDTTRSGAGGSGTDVGGADGSGADGSGADE